MSLFRGFRASVPPVSLALVCVIAGSFLLAWLKVRFITELGFLPSAALDRPWTFITYLFSNTEFAGFIGTLFLCWWVWGIGSVVETDMGSLRYGVFLIIASVLCALAFFIGGLVTHIDSPLIGASMAVSAMTVAWGTRYPNTVVQFMLVIPIKAKYIAWISVGFVFFGTRDMVLALFAVSPMALVYLFAANKLPISYNKSYSYTHQPSKKKRKEDREYYDDVKRREKQREERERLKALFERSLIEDPDDGKKENG